MKHPRRATKTAYKVNKAYQGETIEAKIDRIVNNNEPISDGAPIIFTERKDGVLPEYDIRTDRFDVAIDAMDKVTKTKVAQREERIEERNFDKMTDEQKIKFKEKYPNNEKGKTYEDLGGISPGSK